MRTQAPANRPAHVNPTTQPVLTEAQCVPERRSVDEVAGRSQTAPICLAPDLTWGLQLPSSLDETTSTLPQQSDIEALVAQMLVLEGLRGDGDSFEAACQRLDADKTSALAKLATAVDVNEAARVLAARVEKMHGKPGQTQRALRVAERLLVRPECLRLLSIESSTSPQFTGVWRQVSNAIHYLNLGEVEGATAFYLAEGRPSPEALATFAARPGRAFAIMEKYGIADIGERDLVRDFHSNDKAGRSIATQLVDISERLAAMTAARPQRAALPDDKIAAILKDLGVKGIFDTVLAEAAAQMVTGGVFKDL